MQGWSDGVTKELEGMELQKKKGRNEHKAFNTEKPTRKETKAPTNPIRKSCRSHVKGKH